MVLTGEKEFHGKWTTRDEKVKKCCLKLVIEMEFILTSNIN